jgi:hypothetical protein
MLKFHNKFNDGYGCILGCHGGIAMRESGNYTLCLDPKMYLGVKKQDALDLTLTMPTPCKVADTFYGPMHRYEGQNTTR